MHCAGIYRRGDCFIVYPLDQTTDGVWIDGTPARRLDTTTDRMTLGARAREALEGSRANVPHPVSFCEVGKQVLELAGVRSWGAFGRNATYCSVEREADEIRIVPTRNVRRDGGFDDLTDCVVAIPESSSNGDLGRAILHAMDQCE